MLKFIKKLFNPDPRFKAGDVVRDVVHYYESDPIDLEILEIDNGVYEYKILRNGVICRYYSDYIDSHYDKLETLGGE